MTTEAGWRMSGIPQHDTMAVEEYRIDISMIDHNMCKVVGERDPRHVCM